MLVVKDVTCRRGVASDLVPGGGRTDLPCAQQNAAIHVALPQGLPARLSEATAGKELLEHSLLLANV